MYRPRMANDAHRISEQDNANVEFGRTIRKYYFVRACASWEYYLCAARVYFVPLAIHQKCEFSAVGQRFPFPVKGRSPDTKSPAVHEAQYYATPLPATLIVCERRINQNCLDAFRSYTGYFSYHIFPFSNSTRTILNNLRYNTAQ
jgi:hypothetical protein